MAFYIAPSGIDNRRIALVATELADKTAGTAHSSGRFGWVWVDDDPENFGPAFDGKTGITVLSSGRLSWSALEWARAANLDYQGGLANRLILKRYLDGGSASVAPYNGSAIIAIIDPRAEVVHVWTDQFGYHPCFLYRGEDADSCIVTTFPDALVVDPKTSLTDDMTSMAEFLRAWRTTPPHTYFEEVKHAGSGCHLTIDLRRRRVERRTYWIPFDDAFYPTIDAAAEDLSSALRTAIHERTARVESPLVFVSGGADSRILLFCAANRSKLTAINLYERHAAETRVAAALCESAGCRFLSFQRDNDFYPRTLPDTVRWSGAMWSSEDSHYAGFVEQLKAVRPDLVLTACTTDWLFKGYGLEKRLISLLGRNLPIFAYTNRRIDGFLPNMPSAAPTGFATQIADRLEAWFAGCPSTIKTPRERLMIEDRRIRPTAYTVSVSGSIMYRKFPYDTFFADSRIAHCYSRIHPDWKLNREVWGKTASRICKGAGKIVDANYGWRVDAGKWEKLAVFAVGWIARRTIAKNPASQRDDDRPPSSGSWPELGWYASNSSTLRETWESVSREERERMSIVCAYDPWSRPLESWSSNGNELFRILTLLAYWRETVRRRAVA